MIERYDVRDRWFEKEGKYWIEHMSVAPLDEYNNDQNLIHLKQHFISEEGNSFYQWVEVED